MALVFVFLYAPIVLLIVFSFNSGNSNMVWKGFSLHWYTKQNVMGAARSPRAGDARGPRIGLKWAGEARPFQGFAP